MHVCDVCCRRTTATALVAFISHAGYRMHKEYRNQFIKVLRYVHEVYLSELMKKNDADSRSISTRLQTYLDRQQFLQEPEGRSLPRVDDSSYCRA